jgi:hypothetical protein
VANCSGKRSFLGHWHTVMWGAIACIFCWAIVPSALDQWSPSTLVFLSVPTITAESIQSDTGERIGPQVLTLHEADSWKHFEVESNPPQSFALAIKRQVETTKDDPDAGVVAVLETNSPGESVNDPHVKFGLDQEEAGKKPRLALRFIIPFGN